MRHSRRSLANSKAKGPPMRSFIMSSNKRTDAVIVIDEAGLVMFWNMSAERLLGYHDKEILGKTIRSSMIRNSSNVYQILG